MVLQANSNAQLPRRTLTKGKMVEFSIATDSDGRDQAVNVRPLA
jgi:hypothetical protein